jgi:hypothetical protein
MKLDQERAVIELDRGRQLLTRLENRPIAGSMRRMDGQLLAAPQDLLGWIAVAGDERAPCASRPHELRSRGSRHD